MVEVLSLEACVVWVLLPVLGNVLQIARASIRLGRG